MRGKISLFLFYSLFLFSCHEEQYDKNKVFRYNETSNVSTLDPVFAKDQARVWIVNQIFDGLVELDTNLDVAPCIATHWDVSNDGTEYVFYIRNNVFFHNSEVFPDGPRLVSAYDFEYSFNRLLDTSLVSPGAWVMNNILSFNARNDSLFEIKLRTSFPPFLGLLTMQYFSVIPEEAVEFYGDDFGRNPVGTGPYYFKIWNLGEKLVLRKNQFYFQDSLPKMEAVSISFLSDKHSAFLEFIKGNLDVLIGIDGSYKDELLTFDGFLEKKYHSKFNIIRKPYLNVEYLGFLVDKNLSESQSPLTNIKIRQAINYSFDKNEMIRYLRNGIGTPAIHGFIPKGMPSFTEKQIGYIYNQSKALKLLKQAGYPNGEGLPTITLETNSSYLDLSEYIQKQCASIGIDIDINVNPSSTLRQKIATSKSSFFRASWIADYADAENYLALFYSKNFSPNGPNYTHFKNKEYDSLYNIAIGEITDNIRFKLYQKMDSLIIYNAPIVPLYYDESVSFTQEKVRDLHPNAMNLLDLKFVYK